MKTYTIKQGKHSSGLRFRPHFGKREFSIDVRFGQNTEIAVGGPDWKDWNKLFGLSFLAHQHNSVRIGWRSNPGNWNTPIELAPYFYVRGKRITMGPVISVDPGELVCIDGWEDERGWSFFFFVRGLLVPVFTDIRPRHACFGYYLWPWFGGNCPAPATMQIEMDIYNKPRPGNPARTYTGITDADAVPEMIR